MMQMTKIHWIYKTVLVFHLYTSIQQQGKQFDFTFKIVMIGDSGVGKSCILLRFADDKFNENFYATIGVDFRFKNLTVDDKQIKLQIVKKFNIIFIFINIK